MPEVTATEEKEELTASKVKPYRQPVGKKARKVQRRKIALINANLKANKETPRDES